MGDLYVGVKIEEQAFTYRIHFFWTDEFRLIKLSDLQNATYINQENKIMEIIGSVRSPFVRIVRATARELSLDYTFHQTNSALSLTEEETNLVNSGNPLMKIPILKDGDRSVVDSRVIVNYLARKAQEQGTKSDLKTVLNDDDEYALTLIYGISDSILLRYIFGKTTDLNLEEGYLARCLERVKRTLTELDNQKQIGEEFGLVEIALVCILGFAKSMQVCDMSDYKHLNSVYDRYVVRPSFAEVGLSE